MVRSRQRCSVLIDSIEESVESARILVDVGDAC